MTDKQISIVKSTWGYVIVNSDEAGQLFYNRLFELAPQVKHMFNSDVKTQARKLMSMISVVVTKLDKLNEIIDEVASLAKRHNKYGATAAHYPVVGEALLWTLEQGLKDKWNNEVKEAWTTVYGVLANAMVEAQAN